MSSDEEHFQAESRHKRLPKEESDFKDAEGFTTSPSHRERPGMVRRGRRPYYDQEYESGDGGISTLIPYKNPKALIAYYLGVFGLIPCLGALLGPAALILGILGLRLVRQYPTAKGTGHAIAGIVLGSLELLANWTVILMMTLFATGVFK
jgi:hypothetical protein